MRLRNSVCLFLCFVMLVFTAGSQAEQYHLENLLTGSFDKPLSVRLESPQYEALSQFDSNRLDQLNRLMKHFSFDISKDSNLSEAVFMIDGEAVFSILQNETVNGKEEIISITKEDVHQAGDIPVMEDGSFPAFLDDSFFPVNQLTDDLYTMFDNIRNTFTDLQKENKTDLRLSGFGKAAKRINMTFSHDFVQEHFPESLIPLTESAKCKDFLSALHFSGVQKISLLTDQDDHIIRINYDGKTGFSENDIRNVSLVWKCLRTPTRKKDNFTLKTPAVKGYDRYNIIYDRDLNLTDTESQTLTWDYQIDQKINQVKTQIRFNADFLLDAEEWTGNAVYSKKQDKTADKTTFLMSLKKENDEEYKGTIEFADYSGKMLVRKAVSGLSILSYSGISSPPEDPVLKDPERKTGHEESVPELLQRKIISAIIRKIAELPDEDLAFIRSGIPEETWEAIFH